MTARALFLDRDGTIDHLVHYPSSNEYEAPRSIEDVVFIDGAFEALRQAMNAGWRLFVITNQPSAAKGKVPLVSLVAVQEYIVSELRAAGVAISQAFQCYHHPEAVIPDLRGPCACRKPSPHFLLEAARLHVLDLARSWMIGDQDTDLECGRAAGCRVALVEYPFSGNKRGGVQPDLRCPTLIDTISAIRSLDD